MQYFSRLVGWYWRMARRPYAVLCAVFAGQQAAVLLVWAASRAGLGLDYTSLYLRGGQHLALLAALAAAAVIATRALWHQRGSTRVGYTLLTLPLPRTALLGAGAALCAVLVLGVAALQTVLFFALCPACTALGQRVTAALVSAAPAPPGLYYELSTNIAMQLLLPARPLTLFVSLLTLSALSVGVPCVCCCRGWAKAVSAVLAVLNVGCAVILQVMVLQNNLPEPGGLALWAALLAANILLALRGLRRAELA